MSQEACVRVFYSPMTADIIALARHAVRDDCKSERVWGTGAAGVAHVLESGPCSVPLCRA